MSIETIATDIGVKLLKRGLNALQARFCSEKALSEKLQRKRRGESHKTHICGLCLISKGGKTTLQNSLNKMVINNDALSKKDELLRRDVAVIVTFMNEELIEDDEE